MSGKPVRTPYISAGPLPLMATRKSTVGSRGLPACLPASSRRTTARLARLFGGYERLVRGLFLDLVDAATRVPGRQLHLGLADAAYASSPVAGHAPRPKTWALIRSTTLDCAGVGFQLFAYRLLNPEDALIHKNWTTCKPLNDNDLPFNPRIRPPQFPLPPRLGVRKG